MMNITKLLSLSFFLVAVSINAQDIANHTIGLRLGDSDGFGAEISYQKSLGRYTRLELDLGYRDSREFDAVKAVALFQNVYDIGGGLHWYYGFGGGVGSANFEPRPSANNPTTIITPEGGLFVLAAGDLGIEFDFDNIPLLLSFDIRPEIGLIGFGSFDNSFYFDFGLGIRYQF